MLSKASIMLNSEFGVEFSHHYGAEHFREVGALIIDCINREYCKKLILVLPGQKHPSHFHKRKEETFQVLTGVFESLIDVFKEISKVFRFLLFIPIIELAIAGFLIKNLAPLFSEFVNIVICLSRKALDCNKYFK